MRKKGSKYNDRQQNTSECESDSLPAPRAQKPIANEDRGEGGMCTSECFIHKCIKQVYNGQVHINKNRRQADAENPDVEENHALMDRAAAVAKDTE